MADATFYHGYGDDSIAIIGVSSPFPDSETPQRFWEDIRNNPPAKPSIWIHSIDLAFIRPTKLYHPGDIQSVILSDRKRELLHQHVSCDYEDNVNSHPLTAYSFTGTARAFSSGRISHFFGLNGPSMVIDTACSSSGVAIHTACRAIQSGQCSMALAKGSNLMGPEARLHQNLATTSFLSPTVQCRPFDACADGYRQSEGGGFVLLRRGSLKRLSVAVAVHDCILGVVAASAVNNTKGSGSITLPSAESQSHLYRLVLKTACLQPQQVSYVEAYGTGTQKGDLIERQSIENVFAGHG
ncbi:thiolase-like protein [Fusarium oxysporum II5]|uniref:Ketosynthase family 3 (KS3) domain-containing protein n=2 Tax=Fusarium oxysporum f. sp. cubense (strain race 4) TaxID=2502994 RepID=X0J4U5_FUSO5|nr:uncharacterized protein FOIG_11729 [Fusarium odoratissimum NRRL 54006]EXL96182.1 hypothetical protein FOIG_11729 [Fusarium odoratissimum NRRL 54006]KAK2123954.1 thiolase-like protein [Fusarium oxysporum II5]